MENKDTSISMGLDAIFSANVSTDSIKQSFEITSIPLSLIHPSPFQARKEFLENEITELASSIAEHGLLQPILVRSINHHYELLAGERRFRAMTLLNQPSIPAIIFEASNEMAMAFGLIENIQRANLNPVEEAAAYDRLLNEFKLSHEALAKRMGKSRSHMTNMLRLHRLPDEIKNHVIAGRLSMGHARAILTLAPDEQIRIAQRVIEQGMSVRQLEDYIGKKNGIPQSPRLSATLPSFLESKMSDWRKKLNAHYSADIKVLMTGEGRVRATLEVASAEHLSKLIDELVSKYQ